jgi:hypothetical protein
MLFQPQNICGGQHRTAKLSEQEQQQCFVPPVEWKGKKKISECNFQVQYHNNHILKTNRNPYLWGKN